MLLGQGVALVPGRAAVDSGCRDFFFAACGVTQACLRSRTKWALSYTASLHMRGSLLIWLDKDMTWLAPHDGHPGRPAVFSDTAIQFCLTIKVLFKLPLRQTTGMVASLLKMVGLDWAVPDYTTLCRRQKSLAVQIPYRRFDGPRKLLVDSTGIKFLGDGEWKARKHGFPGRRQWRKVHLAMDTATSDIRAVEFTSSSDGDSPVLPDLQARIPAGEDIGTVTADGAYDMRRCHTAIIDRMATPITGPQEGPSVEKRLSGRDRPKRNPAHHQGHCLWVCSCRPGTTLDSRDESSHGFVQQSPTTSS